MAKYALLGRRLDYSFSQHFFTDFFQKHQLSCSYENIELPAIADVQPLLSSGTFSGFNVTIPYKEEIIPFLDDLSVEAREIGAVNTISYRQGQWIGYNTDAFGFHQSVKPFLTNRHEKALILGTGGAAKAVAYVLKKIGIEVFYVSRNPSGSHQFSYEQVNAHMLNAMKLLVNCTPIGTFPLVDEKPDISLAEVGAEHLVVDLIYNPEKTLFLSMAEKNGATVLNGLSMLHQQALKSWEIWNEELR